MHITHLYILDEISYNGQARATERDLESLILFCRRDRRCIVGMDELRAAARHCVPSPR